MKVYKIENPKQFADKLAKDIFGLTSDDAQETGLCIQCKEPALPKCYSGAGRREYKISGLCEVCFDEITGDE